MFRDKSFRADALVTNFVVSASLASNRLRERLPTVPEKICAICAVRAGDVNTLVSSSGLTSSYPTSSLNSRFTHSSGFSSLSKSPAGSSQKSRFAPCRYCFTRGTLVSDSLTAATSAKFGSVILAYMTGLWWPNCKSSLYNRIPQHSANR